LVYFYQFSDLIAQTPRLRFKKINPGASINQHWFHEGRSKSRNCCQLFSISSEPRQLSNSWRDIFFNRFGDAFLGGFSLSVSQNSNANTTSLL
jgi:hypothetical protein